MDSVRYFTKVPIDSFQDYLSTCDQPFEKSLLYSSSKDAKFVDEDLRKSEFRAITDPKLFDLMETTLISDINKTDKTYQYMLCRNDITHIKYQEGGFFKRHKDFLSITSNLIEEFTLIVCVTPSGCVEPSGVDTTIYSSFGGSSKTFDTSTPGRALLFRKDLEHEGSLLKKGNKHILTTNLWAIRKEQSSQVLLVTFPSVKDKVPNTATSAMESAASEACSYVLPVDNLSGMLAAHVQWANRSAEQQGKDHPQVVTYECQDYGFDSFGVVAKILNRSYISEDAIEKHKDCLGYFGPFQTENLLVELAVGKKDQGAPPQKKQKSQKETSGAETSSKF